MNGLRDEGQAMRGEIMTSTSSKATAAAANCTGIRSAHRAAFAVFAMGALGALVLAGCTNLQPGAASQSANQGASQDVTQGVTQSLIDGAQGLDNWTTLGTANWRAEDGSIVADQPNNGQSGYLRTKQTYGNFHLHAEFWVSQGGKSGVFFRCTDPMQINSKTCYETQIFPKRIDQFGTGALVNVAPISQQYAVANRWNSYDITADGDHLTVTLNGQKTVDVNHPGLQTGLVVLQFRGGVVRYRSLTIAPLPGPTNG